VSQRDKGSLDELNFRLPPSFRPETESAICPRCGQKKIFQSAATLSPARDLTAMGSGRYSLGAMRLTRPILVALVALSVAMLPVTGGGALATPHDTSLTASHTDCCPHGKPCEQKTDDCGSVAGCVLKCCGVLASLPAPIKVALPGFASEKPAHALRNFRSPFEYPPLPPPRV
jgi:hypothetical protein